MQRYYVYLGKELTPALSASLFYDGGNINYYDVRPWRTGYGGSLTYRYSPRGVFELFLQRVKNVPDMYEMSQISFLLTHTYKNLHQLQMRGQYFYYHRHYHNDAMFLLSYSVPFGLPVGPRKDIGQLTGYVYDPYKNAPIAQAMFHCNGERAVSDFCGHFVFKGVPIGLQGIRSDILPENYVTVDGNQLSAHITGGKNTHMAIPVIAACSLEGEVLLFAFEDSFTFWERRIRGESAYSIVSKGGNGRHPRRD